MSWHITTLKFSSWNIIHFWQKRAHQSTIFQTFECFNPLSANPAKWSKTLKEFVGNLPTNGLYVFDHFVGLALKGLMKLHPIPHAIFETARSRFIQVLHHCLVSWKINSLYFFSSNLYTLDKNSPSNWNFQTFEWLGENSPNSSRHVWNYKSVFF